MDRLRMSSACSPRAIPRPDRASPLRSGGTLEEAALPLDPERSTVVGLEIALSREWFAIELADAAARDDQVSLLVRQHNLPHDCGQNSPKGRSS